VVVVLIYNLALIYKVSGLYCKTDTLIIQ